MTELKRVLAVHDISCIGKCSLTVALPIISACGVECSVLPTAVLSTHTGGFMGYTFRDLTDDLEPIISHWESLDVRFDALYSGYLGSDLQVDIVRNLALRLREKYGTIIIIDPVMADEGKLYTGFSPEFPAKMRELCAVADYIMPNFTEASLMLGREYQAPPYSKDYIKEMLDALFDMTQGSVLLTGVVIEDTNAGIDESDIGAVITNPGYPAAGDTTCINKRIPGYFHGTGDVFGSIFTGALLRTGDGAKALELAVSYTQMAAQITSEAKTEARYGVAFEPLLGKLAARLDTL